RVRPELPLVGRLRVQEAGPGPGAEHREEIHRAARRRGAGLQRPGGGDAVHDRPAAPGMPGPRFAGTIDADRTLGRPGGERATRLIGATSPARIATEPRGPPMPTALIVEDEPQANELLSLLVQLRGYETQS